MSLLIPNLDDRSYQELLDEALARIPVHNPEWTNFNRSDPGVTLVEVFAFLTENLLFRSNQIPERNRLKFLSLLGVPIRPASSARGLVTLINERAPLKTLTFGPGLEVRAGQVPYRTERGLDLVPIEAQVFYKRPLAKPPPALVDYYKQLYASFLESPQPVSEPLLYESVALQSPAAGGVDLGQDTTDGSLWIALLSRKDESVDAAREAIGKKVLSLGLVPLLADAGRELMPGSSRQAAGQPLLRFEIPIVPPDGLLPSDPAGRIPQYRSLESTATANLLEEPGIADIQLPAASEMTLWRNLEPLEAGVGDFPPALEDTKLNQRVITWLRVRSSAAVRTRLLWLGINSTLITQRARVLNEVLPNGTGEPDQSVKLSRTPVIPGSVRLSVTVNGTTSLWREISDLLSAGPEVPTVDLRLPPGASPDRNPVVDVFVLDPQSGEIRFGDGTRGKRPPFDAVLRADYDYGLGRAGNVEGGSINSSPALPAGIKVSNPVRTWGGADDETIPEAEKQISRYLQHRNRLVTAEDFDSIVRRAPGVDVGRVDVLSAFHPDLSPNEPGDAPGAVTLMVIPRYDPDQPDAPFPDRLFLDSICSWIDPRRLVTTEVFLRGPVYKPIWVSIGFTAIAGLNPAPVREAVKSHLTAFLSPLPSSLNPRGWSLRKPVIALQLLAEANRVPGVALVNQVLLAEGAGAPQAQIPMRGLELPRLLGIAIEEGDAPDLDGLRGRAQPMLLPTFVPVPFVPEACR